MQRKRNEGGRLAGNGLAVLQRNRTVHGENRAARNENRLAHSEDRLAHNENRRAALKTITTFDTFRQNRDFHRML